MSVRLSIRHHDRHSWPVWKWKSTMLRLIARFYDPQSGAVRFGGIDETTVDPEKLMSKISVVFQDVYLFQDTIGNNIRYGRENATQEEIEAAAKLAHCHDFIMLCQMAMTQWWAKAAPRWQAARNNDFHRPRNFERCPCAAVR